MRHAVRRRITLAASLLAASVLALHVAAPGVEASTPGQVDPRVLTERVDGRAGEMPSAGAPAQEAARVHTADPADEELEARTRAVASQLRCPVCQGLSIEDSPTDLAVDMRAVVKEQLASGRSPEEVKAYFVEKYGEWILLEPRPHGLNLAVYLLPVLGLLIGTGIVVRSARRWTRQTAQEESAL